MAFEAFTSIKSRSTGEPKVSILKQGNFSFNSSTMKLIKDKNIDYVILMFDRDTKRIAFKPAQKGEAGAYTLRHMKGLAQVSGVAFLNNYEINYKEQSISYPVTWSDEAGMLILQL